MKEWASFPIRLGLGVVFMAHGLQNTFGLFGGIGIHGLARMLSNLGFEPSPVFAYCFAGIELIGGLCILIGLFVRTSSVLMLCVLMISFMKMHWGDGFFIETGGCEYNFTLIMMCISLICAGAGKWSVWDRF